MVETHTQTKTSRRQIYASRHILSACASAGNEQKRNLYNQPLAPLRKSKEGACYLHKLWRKGQGRSPHPVATQILNGWPANRNKEKIVIDGKGGLSRRRRRLHLSGQQKKRKRLQLTAQGLLVSSQRSHQTPLLLGQRCSKRVTTSRVGDQSLATA